ncbi:MAG: hypothetical protein IKO10_06935 [Lachnospiraceae bacterium]|nr:hypothetical protein [Lachnospiraceae bacterium]
MNAIIINISGKHDVANSTNGLIRMLTDLFDNRMDGMEKVEILEAYGLELTKEVKSEVTNMCTYATAIENKGIEKGIEVGRTTGQNDLVEAIRRLREGESREELLASGLDEHTVDLAMVVK